MIDLEHGSGDYDSLLVQLQAVEGTSGAAIVRVAWNEAPRFKRLLDLGPSGVMVPWVNTAEGSDPNRAIPPIPLGKGKDSTGRSIGCPGIHDPTH
jgi:2-keto-3-deoxy-L-rhamnonate aldolase RhmA